MHALGSPLHVFDRSTLAEGRIVVRRAAAGEEIRTLDGEVRRLDARDLVIADAERPVAIAGVMGGLDTEVDRDDDGGAARGGELRADHDPEDLRAARSPLRGVESLGEGRRPDVAEAAAVYASELIVDLAGGGLAGLRDVHAPLPERPVVRLRPERTNAISVSTCRRRSSGRSSSGSGSR